MMPAFFAIALFQTVAWHAIFLDATGERALRRRILRLRQVELTIRRSSFAFLQIAPENEQSLAKLLQRLRVFTETVMSFFD